MKNNFTKQRFYYLKYSFKATISIILLGYLFNRYDIINIFRDIFKLGWYPVLLVFFTLIMQQLCNAFIKKNMLSIYNFKMNYLEILRILFIGNLYGSVLPSMIGGDAYYIYCFGKSFKDIPRITSGIILIKIIGITVFLIIGLIFILSYYSFFLNLINNLNYEITGNIFFLSILILSLVLIFLLLKKYSIKIRVALESLSLIIVEIKRAYLVLLKIVVFSIVFYFFSIGGRTLIAKAIGIDLNISIIAFLIILINLIILLPISISGIGIREMLYVFLFSKLGVSNEVALALGILDFSITTTSWIIGGFLLIENKKKLLYG